MGAQQAQCHRSDRAAQYVLGELEARVRLAFERHLAVCPACRDEVELLTRAAEALPLLSAKPQGPDPDDPHLHRHAPALAAIAHASAVANAKLVAAQPERHVELKPSLQAIPGGTPTPTPRVGEASTPRGAASGRPRTDADELRLAAQELRLETAALRSGWTPSASRLIAGRERASLGPRRRISLGPQRRFGPRRKRSTLRFLQKPVPGPAVVGFVAVAIVAIATVALSSRIAGIHYERAKAGWTPGGAVIELAGDQLELLVERMPHPAAGTGYQVWVMERSNGALVPTTAWLRLNRDGNAEVNVPGNYHDWDAAAVYVESLRGHESLKSGAVVVADLRHVA